MSDLKTPCYLSVLLEPYVPILNLRSQNSNFIVNHSYNNSYGVRSFYIASAFIWNSLPVNLKNSPDFNSFKAGLKTYLFREAFNQFL